MIETLFKYIIVPLIVIGVFYVLYKRGVIKSMPLPFVSIFHWKGRRTLRANFFFLSGSRIFTYFLKKETPVRFYYDVTVTKGRLRLVVRSNHEELFEETFTKSDQGYIDIVPKTRFHSIVLDGHLARGKCRCEFTAKQKE